MTAIGLTILATDWRTGVILTVIVMAVLALLCFGGCKLVHHMESSRKAKRNDYIHDVLHGNKTDEQVIRAMSAPIGPKVDIGLIFAVAGSNRMTPKIKSWIMKHYPSALASNGNLTDDEIIRLSELDNSDVDYRLLHRDKPMPVKALMNIADTVDPQILYFFQRHEELMKDKDVARMVNMSVRNTVGF